MSAIIRYHRLPHPWSKIHKLLLGLMYSRLWPSLLIQYRKNNKLIAFDSNLLLNSIYIYIFDFVTMSGPAFGSCQVEIYDNVLGKMSMNDG